MGHHHHHHHSHLGDRMVVVGLILVPTLSPCASTLPVFLTAAGRWFLLRRPRGPCSACFAGKGNALGARETHQTPCTTAADHIESDGREHGGGGQAHTTDGNS